jgi:hypothetical protein
LVLAEIVVDGVGGCDGRRGREGAEEEGRRGRRGGRVRSVESVITLRGDSSCDATLARNATIALLLGLVATQTSPLSDHRGAFFSVPLLV